MELNPSIINTSNNPDSLVQVDDELIEEIWRDLEGRVTHEQIRSVATEIAAGFHNATVTSFIPILLQRKAREQIELMMQERR